MAKSVAADRFDAVVRFGGFIKKTPMGHLARIMDAIERSGDLATDEMLEVVAQVKKLRQQFQGS